MEESREQDLPQPDDDPQTERSDVGRDHPTSGPGNVSVDEPTQSARDPRGEADEWREEADEVGDQDVRNVGADKSAAGGSDADAATS